MTIIKFNTGREYTKNGQRIAASLQDSGDIVFVDVDRQIDGVIRANGLTLEDVLAFGYFTQRGIMESYDKNEYIGDLIARELLRELREAAATL
tara:strand:- start:7423 stop:7701 length:279 start_codon:yes stop_codon:yes gene_type:complete